MAPFTHHIFVCCNYRQPGHRRGCCDPEGDDILRDLLKSEIKRRGLKASVRANKAGCLDQCEMGPVLVIYPQAIWYGGVREKDVPRIVEETIINGQVIEDLLISDELLNTKGRPVDKRQASSPISIEKDS